MDEKFMTVDELAKTLRVPKSWVYGKTRETGPESIPRLRVGKYNRFLEADVLRWLQEKNEGAGNG